MTKTYTKLECELAHEMSHIWYKNKKCIFCKNEKHHKDWCIMLKVRKINKYSINIDEWLD